MTTFTAPLTTITVKAGRAPLTSAGTAAIAGSAEGRAANGVMPLTFARNLLEALHSATLDRKYGFGTYGPMRISLTYGVILAAMWLPLDAYAADAHAAGGERFIPDCAGEVAIAHARIARVESDGALILPDGRTLVLEGLRLPLKRSEERRV